MNPINLSINQIYISYFIHKWKKIPFPAPESLSGRNLRRSVFILLLFAYPCISPTGFYRRFFCSNRYRREFKRHLNHSGDIRFGYL